ncbi:MAG TPA: hypothetical protein VFG35_08965 [Actinoplanes sp.]|nr:hypothetical protein [Actinoplanes sp.]
MLGAARRAARRGSVSESVLVASPVAAGSRLLAELAGRLAESLPPWDLAGVTG